MARRKKSMRSRVERNRNVADRLAHRPYFVAPQKAYEKISITTRKRKLRTMTATPGSGELLALAGDCERYAKIIEGIIVVPDDYRDGDATERREPRTTLLKAAAALRLAAKPAEEGVREAMIEECAKIAALSAAKHHDEARDLFKKRGEFEARAARDAAYDIEETIRALSATGEPKT